MKQCRECGKEYDGWVCPDCLQVGFDNMKWVDRCVCCGEIIPEGRMVCPTCERKAKRKGKIAEK